ncbi:MAG TPA: (d)CMP kinase [Geminicoccaceae bacterium]|nr:(d)CMP kinase [Geminicoccaceae bacterium]
MTRPLVIAVDGPAASGKSTLARRLAAHLGFPFLDTGLIYRAVGHRVLARGRDPADLDAAVAEAEALEVEDVDHPGLRAEAVGRAASQVAAHKSVRDALLPFQRRFAAQLPGAVLAGRDIGTEICPDARVKIFITADVEERARRRYAELRQRGEPSIYERVLDELRERDRRDQERAVAPLRAARDAWVLDTTRLDADAAFAAAVAHIGQVTGRPGLGGAARPDDRVQP